MVDDDSGRVLDEALMRTIARRLGELTLVDTVSVFPGNKPDSVVAEFDRRYYPERFDRVTLELRFYAGGEFHVTYREASNGTTWLCRWDRHDNPHSARDHFHRPPGARTEDAVDREYPTDAFAVIETVLGWIDDRIGDVWDDTPPR